MYIYKLKSINSWLKVPRGDEEIGRPREHRRLGSQRVAHTPARVPEATKPSV